MNNKYDIAIAYRIYPGVSKVPPVFHDDKLRLSELCLYSFKESLSDLKFKIFVLLDNCPDIYTDLFKKYFSDDELELIRLDGIGNAETFKMQMDLLLKQDYSDYIYFAEDDYFYLPRQFRDMLKLIKINPQVDFATPYDHIDYYRMPIHKQFRQDIIKSGQRDWKTVSTTTMTFITNKETLKKVYSNFYTYTRGNADASIWLSLTKHKVKNPFLIIKYYFIDKLWFKLFAKAWYYSIKQIWFGGKYQLWSPTPSIATHMDNKCLAPGVDWGDVFRNTKEKINFVS
ncbi:glycosyltransferase family 2 protein [Bacteroidota bacterium]